jgi:hypothetical protein
MNIEANHIVGCGIGNRQGTDLKAWAELNQRRIVNERKTGKIANAIET